MNIDVKYVPAEINKWVATRAIAAVLHAEDFKQMPDGKRINFQIHLNPSKAGGIRNDGTGLLTLPWETVGIRFLERVRNEPIKINGQKIKFFQSKRRLDDGMIATLRKTRYVDPNIEEERLLKVHALETQFRVDSVQFGIFYRPDPSPDRQRPSSRSFSVEWERSYSKDGYGCMAFEYDHKLIRITLGDQTREKEGRCLAINFASIQKIGVGYDGKPYVCFDTLTPPIMEKINFHRTMTGESRVDNKKYKERVGSIHEGHKNVAPYCPHLRLTLHNDPEPDVDVAGDFIEKCLIAGLSQSMIIRLDARTQIEALKKNFFTPKRIFDLEKTLSTFEWPIAFQLESLLHNGLLHTDDMDRLIPKVRNILAKRPYQGAVFVGDLLRRYNEDLQLGPPLEGRMERFDKIHANFTFATPNETFRCNHITFTPTRMILEGPYAFQSNRVIRQYKDYQDHFIRVDFRDEDRLQYRWEREVDGTPFLMERVGGILKNGFTLARRRFEFLAYSNSALRDHAVWFMNPFIHPEKGLVVANSIRKSLGDFSGTKLLKQPSKYAARLAQAFTATDPSINILREEWEEVDDLGRDPYYFTDGVGTISMALGDRIWEQLCQTKPNAANLLKPSAYQIRFLGYKGMVAIDIQLDKNPKGIHMRLRHSMKKFEVKDDTIAPIEIAQAFEQPNTCYLNRPLIMILEDLGVRKEAFEILQENTVKEAKTIDDSIMKFAKFLKVITWGLDTLRQVAMVDILRDIKHSARIPVPNSYLLVGVADEGPAYEKAGERNVYCLKEGEIYVCVQRRDEEPIWIEGNVSISRSPVVHPGDVQRVRAIGKLRKECFVYLVISGMSLLCLLKACFSISGTPRPVADLGLGARSLASCLGGGDLDGDLFSVICDKSILPRTSEGAANYDPSIPFELDRDTNVDDICNFIVEYIHSDVLGLLSDRLLIIADQSNLGIRDPHCLMLAELCSKAVDYPKQGNPLNLDGDSLPRTLIRCKPDWHAAEVISPRKTDYYDSSRALGSLYRSITLEEPEAHSITTDGIVYRPFSDPISIALLEDVKLHLGDDVYECENPSFELTRLFKYYCDELRYICATHTLSNTPGVRLLEAEIVIGTILAKCSQKRWRKDRIYRMRLHAGTLVRDVQRTLLKDTEAVSYSDIVESLRKAWSAWNLSLRQRNNFGANSFGLVALGTIFDCLEYLEQ